MKQFLQDNIQHFIFKRMREDDNTSSTIEYMHTCSDDATWDSVMLHFASFLDSCGYVGVHDRVEHMLREHE